jgi:hypothetical protein
VVRSGTVFEARTPVVTAAVIAAQATLIDGFRQRDVRFFIELFSNWLEQTTGDHTLAIHNTQVQRHLDGLASARFATRVGRAPPRFRLTPEGLVELLHRLVNRADLMRLDEFFLVFHFVDAYGPRLRSMATHGGALASRLLAVDLDELVDPSRLLSRERERVARELSRLGVRCDESRKTGELARTLAARGESLANIVSGVEKQFPYELNSQKPLTELLTALPEPWRKEELMDIAERRANRFWEPLRALLAHYDAVLADLQANTPARPSVAKR